MAKSRKSEKVGNPKKQEIEEKKNTKSKKVENWKKQEIIKGRKLEKSGKLKKARN